MTTEQEIHNKENCWKTKDGEYIPLSEMSNSHLRNAKHYAQAKEEYFWKKMCEFGDMIDALDKEAERRGITLKDRRCKFQRNQRTLKKVIHNEES
jgi:translation initiation factor 2 alpha subunit (eIF-2alpha)